ncbi:MAG: hypothetical protein LWW99_04545 [Deltaproteobacteria bacterium]|nr:hypothetical protein [Deltaproteobacteria bacterium]
MPNLLIVSALPFIRHADATDLSGQSAGRMPTLHMALFRQPDKAPWDVRLPILTAPLFFLDAPDAVERRNQSSCQAEVIRNCFFKRFRKAGYQMTCLNKKLPYEGLRCQEVSKSISSKVS